MPLTLQALQHKFGDVVAGLHYLPDFHLFEQTPEAGQYFVGFGKAFSINLKESTLVVSADSAYWISLLAGYNRSFHLAYQSLTPK